MREPPADAARSKNLSMYRTSIRENREIPRPPDHMIKGGTLREGKRPKPEMHGRGESDRPVLPAKAPNKAGQPAAEVPEERGNTDSSTRSGLSAGPGVSSGLDRVSQVARRDKDARFTALLHHVDIDRLRSAYRAIRPQAAPGINGVTWQDYGENLEDLLARVHSGAYRARPSWRVYIPKADGRKRPLGIATLEDKILQRAVVEVLNAIYEEDFVGFSYGLRPGHSPHHALDALAAGICKKKVNWVLDADICDFFSRLDHVWELAVAPQRRHKDREHRRQAFAGRIASDAPAQRQAGDELVGIGRPSPGTGPHRADPAHLSQRTADVVAVPARQFDELVEDPRLVRSRPTPIGRCELGRHLPCAAPSKAPSPRRNR